MRNLFFNITVTQRGFFFGKTPFILFFAQTSLKLSAKTRNILKMILMKAAKILAEHFLVGQENSGLKLRSKYLVCVQFIEGEIQKRFS